MNPYGDLEAMEAPAERVEGKEPTHRLLYRKLESDGDGAVHKGFVRSPFATHSTLQDFAYLES